MLRALCLTLLLASPAPAFADVAETVADHILPRHRAFAASTAALARAAEPCGGPDLIAAWQTAYDDWMGIQHIRLGPIEEDGRGLAIAFWPDPKGMGLRAQRALIAGDPAALEPAAFSGQSVAARGLTGLERLLFAKDDVPGQTCALIRATATDLARVAGELDAGWRDDFGPLLTGAGADGNTRFLSQAEARQALFTQIVTGLEYIKDQRLGRPLGSFDRPTPDRAEARASGRSQRNAVLSLQAIRQMVATLSSDAPRTLAALDRATALVQALPDPTFAGTATPQGRLRVEIAHQAVDAARATALEDLGPALGVTVGFNAMDGD